MPQMKIGIKHVLIFDPDSLYLTSYFRFKMQIRQTFDAELTLKKT